MNILLLLAGFVVLVFSGEILVRGAAALALKAKISPLVVGLTIVSLGTSSPELFASLQAALKNSPDISVGNVVGSNIANLALVLGVTAMIFPIVIQKSLLRQEWPMLIIATLAFYIFSLDGQLSFVDGFIFISTLLFFTIFLILRSRWQNKKLESTEETNEFQKLTGKPSYYFYILIVLGCIGLYYGSEWFLDGAIILAKDMGISDHVVGVTVVAFGTSIPELAASGVAAYRKQSDISIGNLIGSNIFNIFGVLGITSMVSPLNISEDILSVDFYWMLGIALILFPILFFGKKVSRFDGAIMLILYGLYIFFITR